MGFFDKIKQGLAKTRAALSNALDEVFANADAIDEDFYEELEETLILADLGMDTVNKLMKELRYRVVNRGLTTTEHVKFNLKLILNDMLRDNYSLYTGNAAVLEKVASASPHTVLTVAIPAEDFANAVNRYFGGSASSHKSGDWFSYLPGAQVYTTPLQPVESPCTVTVERAEETLHAYRLYFRISEGDATSETYIALFVKREDGSCYLRALGGG